MTASSNADPLCDPRLSRVSPVAIKDFLAGTDGIDQTELAAASTKFALVALAEDKKISLEGLLDEKVKAVSSRPPTMASDRSSKQRVDRPRASGTPRSTGLDSGRSSERTGGAKSKSKTAKSNAKPSGGKENKKQGSNVAASAAPETVALKKRRRRRPLGSSEGTETAKPEDTTADPMPAKETCDAVEDEEQRSRQAAMEAAIEEADARAALAKVKELASESKLAIDHEGLNSAISDALAIGVSTAVLGMYEETAVNAKFAHGKAHAMATVGALTEPEVLRIEVASLREAIDEAVLTGVPKAELAEAGVKLEEAKMAQARQMILDVHAEVCDPATYSRLNTAELRSFLAPMTKPELSDVVGALTRQIEEIEAAQQTVKEMRALAYPERGILKVATAKLRLALDEAKQSGVPESLLRSYRERLGEASLAQEHLKVKDRLTSQIKAAKASKRPLDQAVMAQWEADLDDARTAIYRLDKKPIAA